MHRGELATDTGPVGKGTPRLAKARSRRPQGRLLSLLLICFGLSVVVGSLLEPSPALAVSRLVPGKVEAAGRAAALPWPASGQAALATAAGQLIGSSGSERAVPIASVTKVMTALLVLRHYPLATGRTGFRLRITAVEAASLPQRYAEGQSLLPVQEGEVFTERQALEALLIPSADNMADALASYVGPSTSAFVGEMNSTAKSLGMTHTHFADASGYDPRSVSDATDLLKLARAAMAIPAFASIVAMPAATLAGETYQNYNSLVGRDGFTGIKTGSTSQAGQALLFSVRRDVDGREVSVVGDVLEQHGPGAVGGALTAARKLADGYFSALAWRTALPAGSVLARVERAGEEAYLTSAAPLKVLSLPQAAVRLSARFYPQGEGRGERIVVTARSAGSPAERLLARARPLPSPGFIWKLEHFL